MARKSTVVKMGHQLTPVIVVTSELWKTVVLPQGASETAGIVKNEMRGLGR